MSTYVNSTISTFNVTLVFDPISGSNRGTGTISYSLGAGNTLMLLLIQDDVGLVSVNDNGSNTYATTAFAAASGVYITSGPTNHATQLNFLVESPSATGPFTVTVILGEYSAFAGNVVSHFFNNGTAPLTEIAIVSDVSAPPAGVRLQLGSVGGGNVWAGFVVIGTLNPGAANIHLTGPDATYGGTERQVIQNRSSSVGKTCYALLDNLAGVTALSEKTDVGFSSANFIAFFSIPPTTTQNIIVQKQTSPPGSVQSFTFTPSWGAPFTLLDGQQHDSGTLAPGTYSVVETPIAGWTTTTSSDPANIVVTSGNTTTIVFTNTAPAPPVPPPPPPGGGGGGGGAGGGGTGGGPPGAVLTSGPCPARAIKALNQVDTWELDHGIRTWTTDQDVPLAWHEDTNPQQTFSVALTPANNGTIELLYVALADTLTGAGVNFVVPDDWVPYILWGTLAELLGSDGPAFDPVRAQYCTQRYEEGVELARLVLGGK